MFDHKLLNEALETYGNVSQIYVIIEELSELTKELTKFLRNSGYHRDNVKSELSDVYICLEHVKQIFYITETEIQQIVTQKQDRLRIHLEEVKK